MTPLSLLRALTALLSYHQSERLEIQETATRQELRFIDPFIDTKSSP